MSPLETAIFSTVAYFDIFDYPLTAFEIWQYLSEPTDFLTIQTRLSTSLPGLETKSGFFFLAGRSALITTRQDRYKLTNKKIKILKRRLRLITWLPSIRLVCLANSIGTHNLRASSDSDLFIITRAGQVWWVKLWATLILKICNLRPTQHHSADRLCLSFLIDDTALDLSACRQANDRYFTYWLTGLVPLYGDLHVYEKLITANTWLKTALPNWSLMNTGPLYRYQAKMSQTKKIKPLQQKLETWAQRIQTHFMNPALKVKQTESTGVIISDHILKLHTTDRRNFFQTEYQKRLELLKSL